MLIEPPHKSTGVFVPVVSYIAQELAVGQTAVQFNVY